MSTEVLDYSEYMNSCFVTIKKQTLPSFLEQSDLQWWTVKLKVTVAQIYW